MNKFHEEPGKNLIFFGVVALFLLSVGILVYGLLSENKSAEVPVTDFSAIVNNNIEDTSLSEYFNSRESSNSEKNSELYYLETDPFRETCEKEGGSFATRCYY